VKNTAKHVHLVDLCSPYEAKCILGIASELTGGLDNLVDEPIVSSMLCVVAPLTIDETALDTIMVFAEKGLPISSVSMPLGGGTGPATPAGIVALSNAEVLGALAIVESLCPGTPVVYTPVPAVMDPRRGGVGYSRVRMWMNLAVAQMARHYSLPCSMPTGNGNCSVSDFEAGVRIGASVLSSMLGGADIFTGAGLVDMSTTLVLDKLVIDAEIHDYINGSLNDQPIDDETLAVELIAKVGPTGHFLAEEHTRRHVGEYWDRDMPTRKNNTIAERARRKVREILATRQPSWLESSTERRIDSIVSEAQRNYRHQSTG